PVPPPPPLPSGAVTVFPDSGTPATADYADTSAITVGMTFSSDVAGQVLGVRFYKGPLNTGTHTGSLWNTAGTSLASATFTGEASVGGQWVFSPQPVTLTAGTVYIVSYNTTVGEYAVDLNGLSTAMANGHLSVPANGGRYKYGSAYP